jgi:hypothetical protein
MHATRLLPAWWCWDETHSKDSAPIGEASLRLPPIPATISPAALRGGTPLFQTSADLGLLDARRFDGSDNVLLR